MVWFVGDVFGHKESQLKEIMWSVFSLVVDCLNYLYHRHELLYGMTLVFLKPDQPTERID